MIYDLVFEGGGAKGIVFVGAMQAFAEANHTFDRLVGTSSGAIMATFLAAGYGVEELERAMLEKQGEGSLFASFMDVPKPPTTNDSIRRSDIIRLLRGINLPFVPNFLEDWLDIQIAKSLARNEYGGHAFGLIDKGGVFTDDTFLSWLRRKLDEGAYKGEPRAFSRMTLKQFFEATQVELTITASDVTAQRLLMLNHRTAPDLSLVWAIRMSMNLPFVWQEVRWQAGWGTYQGKHLTGNVIVDGGMLSNFPLELLISDDPIVTNVMGEKHNHSILGLMIDEGLSVPFAPDSDEEKNAYVDALSNTQTMRRLRQVIDMALVTRDKDVVRQFESLVVRLPAQGFGTTEFGMSDARRDALVESGRRTMGAWFNRPIPQAARSLETDIDKSAVSEANRLATKLCSH